MTGAMSLKSEDIDQDDHKGNSCGQEIRQSKTACNESGLSKLDLLIKAIIILLLITFQICGCAGPESDDPGDDAGKNADVAGQWKGTTTVPNRSEYRTAFNLIQDGNNLSGTWEAVSEDESYHSEDISGEVKDSTITISVVVGNVENSDNYLEFAYSGDVNGSNISGAVTIKGDWNGEKIDDQGSFTLARLGDNTDNNGGNVGTTIEITDHIEQPTTWESRNVYVIVSGSFYVQNSLTIQAGTIVKIQPRTDIRVEDEGLIIARGTADAPIVFTSYKDDTHGGDTNGDGNVSAPAMSDWNNIDINSTQGSVFDHCHFLYGGSSGNGTLQLDYSQAAVTHCVFAHNNGTFDGYHTDGALKADSARLNTVISDNRFYDNVVPLSINANYDLDDSNTFQDESGTVTNTYNAIFCNTDIGSNRSWGETDVAFVISSGFFSIDTGITLSLADNVVLKFTNGSRLMIEDGDRGLINHDGGGVHFTSFRDDSLKGDSNGDGDVTSPAEGDWQGVYYSGDYYSWPNIHFDSH
jgi:hypothetical protein